ncbi:MAG: 30S ribosomal protein S3 [Candidatus Pacearchaeota archaeon]
MIRHLKQRWLVRKSFKIGEFEATAEHCSASASVFIQMEEKKFVTFKKEELGVKEYIKNSLGKGRISQVVTEYTPVGEKIIITTSKPGLVIGKRGEKIEELTKVLKKRFHFDNPHIEIREIKNPFLDAQLVADEIAILLERQGPLKFKIIAYKMLDQIMAAGALGAEIVLGGKLPSERARDWRFAQGYLKKTGDPAKVVDRAQSQAVTIPGVVGIQVAILPPEAPIHDKIEITPEMLRKIELASLPPAEEEKPKKEKKKRKAGEKEKSEKKSRAKKEKSKELEKAEADKLLKQNETKSTSEVTKEK